MGFSLQIQKISSIRTEKYQRIQTGICEFDRVLGGGLVPDSVILFSGEPGIGKSTFILQICDKIAVSKKVLYISGEESPEQIKKRADRLRINTQGDIYFFSSVNLMEIDQAIQKEKPDIVIIDSIQTIYHPDLESAPGNVSQVKECSSFLFRKAKEDGFILLLIGHVTKDGSIAGPKIMEHLVDVVLHFEGSQKDGLRLLRSRKNRFGNTLELGVFSMTSAGLKEISDTAGFFLDTPEQPFSGTAITTIFENRVLFLEIQALVSRTPFGMPQRTVMGFDHRRLSLIVAILEKRLGIMLKNYDIFIKVLGGLKIDDPAVDMAVIMAIISSYYDFVIPHQYLFMGEVGLGGEFRPIHQIDPRLEEAARLKFKKIFIPARHKQPIKQKKFPVVPVGSVNELVQFFRNQILKNKDL
jgi:DNA repair protein RadA/Sms